MVCPEIRGFSFIQKLNFNLFLLKTPKKCIKNLIKPIHDFQKQKKTSPNPNSDLRFVFLSVYRVKKT